VKVAGWGSFALNAQDQPKQPSRQGASKPYVVRVLVSTADEQTIGETIFCADLHEPMWLKDPGYLGQQTALTRQSLLIGIATGTPFKNEVQNYSVICRVGEWEKTIVPSTGESYIINVSLFAPNFREYCIDQTQLKRV
jgi:hypothetical protein